MGRLLAPTFTSSFCRLRDAGTALSPGNGNTVLHAVYISKTNRCMVKFEKTCIYRNMVTKPCRNNEKTSRLTLLNTFSATKTCSNKQRLIDTAALEKLYHASPNRTSSSL